ncbi:hypothetical protein E2C01_031129 [Portunus trituberculatus]|uniref:Uncharacterized protein n=1 Tax=Portunus trituberculatus TaxID=210409 RepID=A0A5B7ESQ7_PORTR|nr:hypothetical protein [Portunus trituberculatus]
MAKYQDGTWWDSNLPVDVCPIPHSPPYLLGHRLHFTLYTCREEGDE